MIIAHGADAAYKMSMEKLKKEGTLTSPRGQKVIEIIGESIRILNPRDRLITEENRKFPLKGALAEFLWYMTGNPRVDVITPYLKHWEKYSDNGITVNSNYGYRWKDQVPKIIEKIKKDRDTRQAVVNLYDDRFADYYGKDNVCTPTFQFFLRDNLLYLIVNARSRDIIRGECIDQFTFTCLQELVANELGVDMGYYQVNVGSLHIYEEHFDLLDKTMKFNSDIKGDISHRIKLNYNTFWKQILGLANTEFVDEDFMLSLIKLKEIDYDGFYKRYEEGQVFGGNLRP